MGKRLDHQWARIKGVSKAVQDHDLILGIAVIALVAIISIAINMQGWRSRIPAFDLLTYIYGIRNFLETGVLPQHGDTGSYGSYKPPGTAWLMLPSTVLFADPRLSEYAGTALLHVLTLAGIYLLARDYFGTRCAIMAVLLYGLAEHGLFLAGSLWPNGRPDFYVWIIYFIQRWVTRNNARYLAAALAVWLLGIYVDMAIVPLIFLFPVIWIYYKPPVHLRPLLVVGAVLLLIWSPYLRFEASRQFVDIRSQLLQQSIYPANYRDSWCNPGLTIQRLAYASDTAPPGLISPGDSLNTAPNLYDRLMNSGRAVVDKIISNYRPILPVPGVSYILLLLTLGSMLILSLPGYSASNIETRSRADKHQRWLRRIAVGLTLGSLLLILCVFIYLSVIRNGAPPGPKSSLVLKMLKITLTSGIAILVLPWITSIMNNTLDRMQVSIQSLEQAERTRLLVFSLLIPWLILLLMAEPGKPERFWWLWPLQAIFLAAFFTNVLPRFRISPVVIWSGQILVLIIVAVNPFLISKINAWATTGWAGRDAAEIQVVDYITSQIAAQGKDRSAIGYQIFIYPFMAEYNITNPIYKVGAEFDLLFRYRGGIINTNQCAEGIDFYDEYRIVELKPKPWSGSPNEYFDLPEDARFHLVFKTGNFQVYQRD